MIKFLITNRERITSLDGSLQLKHVVISICCPHNDFPKLPENDKRLGLLQLKFVDLDKADDAKQIGQEHLLMTEEQAKVILAFVDKYYNLIEAIICQCDAGVSRSAGVAAALSKILNGDDSWVFNSKEYIPNMYVYRMIINKYYNNL